MADALERHKAPRFTFIDPHRKAYRPRFTRLNGGRWHPFLRKPDGSFVTEEADVEAAMAAYCRRCVEEDVLDPRSAVARLYLSAEVAAGPAEIIPIPLPRRAPPRPSDQPQKIRAPTPGWHGMDILSIEVDHRLIRELTPDGSAVKIGVVPRSPAAKARLRTGDYVLSIGQAKLVPLRQFDTLELTAGAGIMVLVHRPGRDAPGKSTFVPLILRRRPGQGKPPIWQRHPRIGFGERVERDERKEFLAEMARHPHLDEGCVSLLVHLLHYYQGPIGICPAYQEMARREGRTRRTMIRRVDRLEWFGILEPLVGKGPMTQRGPKNLYIARWPEGWVRERDEKRLRGDKHVTS